MKSIRQNDDVLTRVLGTMYFNVVKHTITVNILKIAETHTIFLKVQQAKYIVQVKNAILRKG